LDPQVIEGRMGKFNNHRDSMRILIKRNLTLKEAIYIQSRALDFSEFEIEIEPTRSYPFQQLSSHILGYVSEISSQELLQNKARKYKLGDEIGKSGIEKKYEHVLRGQKGTRIVIKDSFGRTQKLVSEKKPQIGNKITLTIDMELQKYIENMFKSYKGCIGVVKLPSGEILALVSKPNFNPEQFTTLMEAEAWNTLINDPDKPLHNKFIQGLYSPGSVFKIVMALAALQEKIITPSTRTFCSGSIWIYNRVFNCWTRSGHGWMNLTDALKNSCNIYFYTLGKKTDIKTINRYARLLGLGENIRIGLPNEKKGLIPTPAWKLSKLNQKWFPGETISVSIGGGMINVTPIQILHLISTLALRGKSPRLHLIKGIEINGESTTEPFPEIKRLPIEEKYFDMVIRGLYKAVNDGGTGRAAAIPGLDICGKTGTQQIISKENPNYKRLSKQKRFTPHSWFASFASRENPHYAVVVFVEHGGDAGEVAAPIAARIYKKLFRQ
jgi:penicillin-binding protein 2